jgi:hypothetical protein
MRKTGFILIALVLIAAGCKQNKPATGNNTETDLPVQTQDTITNIEISQTEVRQEKISILILPPADGMVSTAGITPDFAQYLATALAMDSALCPIKFPYKKLQNTPYLHIFDKRYCKPISDKVETDIIIMSELEFVHRTGNINSDQWHIRIRIYNTKTDRQIDSKVKAKNLPAEEMNDFILKRRNELISEIKTIYKETE